MPFLIGLLVAVFLGRDTPARNPEDRAEEGEDVSEDTAPTEAPSDEDGPAVEFAGRDAGVDASFLSFSGDGGAPSDAYAQRTVSPAEAVRLLTSGFCDQFVPCEAGAPGHDYAACVEDFNESYSRSIVNRFFGLASDLSLPLAVGEGSGVVSADAEALDRCLEGIRQVTCGDVVANRRGLEERSGELLPENPFDLSIEMLMFRRSPTTSSCDDIFEREEVHCRITPSGEGARSVPDQLSEALCNRMVACNPERPCESCLERAGSASLAGSFGLSGGTLGGISWGLSFGLYEVNQEALNRCLSDIAAISCGSMTAGPAALRVSVPRGPDSCSEVFSEHHEDCVSASSDPASRLASTLCSRLTYCEPDLACDACLQGVLATNTLSDDLGLSAGMTLSGMMQAVGRGRITVNEEALNECLTGIEDLSCTRVWPAWALRTPTSFRRIDSMLRGAPSASCRQVFLEP